jgi:hypothetical protein
MSSSCVCAPGGYHRDCCPQYCDCPVGTIRHRPGCGGGGHHRPTHCSADCEADSDCGPPPCSPTPPVCEVVPPTCHPSQHHHHYPVYADDSGSDSDDNHCASHGADDHCCVVEAGPASPVSACGAGEVDPPDHHHHSSCGTPPPVCCPAPPVCCPAPPVCCPVVAVVADSGHCECPPMHQHLFTCVHQTCACPPLYHLGHCHNRYRHPNGCPCYKCCDRRLPPQVPPCTCEHPDCW